MGTMQFLKVFRDAIETINDEHYFNTERGYQGQLLSEIDNRMKIDPILPGEPIIEQEYQKTLKNHGITIRPDIIIHIPFREGIHGNRKEGNYVVIQLKLKGNEKIAVADFDKIDLMFENLHYPLGIFLNINSDNNYFESYSGKYKERLHCFAVKLLDDEVVINESPNVN